MFIAWGSRTEAVYVCPLEPQHCSLCGETRSFNMMLHYRVHHIWYLFRWVRQKVYTGECATCGRALEMDGEEAERSLAKSPIRFLDRFGWAIGLGAFILLVAVGGVFSVYDRQQDETYLAAPQPNDIYEVDLARISDHPQASVMYAALRVRSVGPQGVEVQVANLFYDRVRGVQRDVNRGMASRESYYGTERLTIPIAELQRLHRDGILVDVVR